MKSYLFSLSKINIAVLGFFFLINDANGQTGSLSDAVVAGRSQDTADQLSPLLTDPRAERTFSAGLDSEIQFADPSPGDSDLGDQLIFRESPKLRPFRASVDTFVFATDNAANLSRGEVDDVYFGTRVAAGVQHSLGRRWFVDLDVSQQILRYDEFDVLDFELLDVSANLIHILPVAGDILLLAGPRFQHLTNDDFSNELFNSVSLRVGAQKAFLIDYKNTVSVGINGEWDVHHDIDVLTRYQYSASVGWSHKLMRDLTFSTSFRFAWIDYPDFDREDALSIAGASLTWSPRPWIDFYLSASWSHNDSSLDFLDYTTLTGGGGIGAKIRF